MADTTVSVGELITDPKNGLSYERLAVLNTITFFGTHLSAPKRIDLALSESPLDELKVTALLKVSHWIAKHSRLVKRRLKKRGRDRDLAEAGKRLTSFLSVEDVGWEEADITSQNINLLCLLVNLYSKTCTLPYEQVQALQAKCRIQKTLLFHRFVKGSRRVTLWLERKDGYRGFVALGWKSFVSGHMRWQDYVDTLQELGVAEDPLHVEQYFS